MKIDIAEILKNEPKGIELYDALRDKMVTYDFTTNGCVRCCIDRGISIPYSRCGTWPGALNGLQILLPSKEMQDWNKFAWKKGDVLKSVSGRCIFKEWIDDSYTLFKGMYVSPMFKEFTERTSDWERETDQEAIDKFIQDIEQKYGGNLETLETEKSQFKNGDILVAFNAGADEERDKFIFIYKKTRKDKIRSHAFLGGPFQSPVLGYSIEISGKEFRLATDSEKQQLFEALAKQGIHWNSETKFLEDMPKEHEFKPKDWCLMCNFIHGGIKTTFTPWVLSQYSHYDGQFYFAVGGNKFDLCVPYNNQTKNMLGTADIRGIRFKKK